MNGGETTIMGYKIHRFNIRMEQDQDKLEQYLNHLHGDVVAIIPHVISTLASTVVNFLFIVEQVS